MGESRIRPIEPVERIEPLQPIGGPMTGSEAPDAAADADFMVKDNLAEDISIQAGNVKAARKKARKKLSMYDITKENDIKFKGFLSYRHFRIMGWVCMAITIINIFLGMGMKVSAEVSEKYSGLHEVFSFFAEFAIFFFLFANFAVIIDKKSSYKKLFIMYGGLTIGFVLLFVIVYYRYLYGSIKSISTATGKIISSRELLNGSFVAFNVFLDLLLCTAVVFFVDYRPKKWFVGKKIYIFRAFAAIPILYELGCILLKYFNVMEDLQLHPMVSPFLTTKPVMCFLLFVRMAFYIKGRETKFLKNGKTIEDYNAFLKTNKNSFQFAKKFAVLMLIYGVIDFIFVICMIALNLYNLGLLESYLQMGNEEAVEISNIFLSEMSHIGFGSSVMMIALAPVILLFSYTKSYKKSKVDMLIPIAAVVVIGLIILEGFFRVIWLLPDKVMDLFEILLLTAS